MTKEEFIDTYCRTCGDQICMGPDDEFSEGCKCYEEVFLNGSSKARK